MKEIIKQVIKYILLFIVALTFVTASVFIGNYVQLEKGELLIIELKVERL